jgi:NADPH:quinone reductase-like Zn-dependent oxidoreductase
MKAFRINRYSKTDTLALVEVPAPKINEHEVLVEIYAASINQLDAKLKHGDFKLLLPYKMPLILGHDVAGVILQVGSKVKNFQVGDEIYSRLPDFSIGGFAEYVAIDENDIALKPTNMTMEEAASIPLVGLTAWQALVEIAQIKNGQKVFIQAGSGGVGTIAIQLAKYLGATVATTASKKSFDQLSALGADLLIDYKTEKFEEILSDYDVVLHSQDTKTLEKGFDILKPGGKVISISGPPTVDFAQDLGLAWYMKLIISLLSRGIEKKANKLKIDYTFLFMRANGQQLAEITKLIEANQIKAVIDQIFPFEKTNDALTYVESGRAKGKVVLTRSLKD